MFVYLDFQKAFDKVSHTKLIVTIMRYGISREIVRWVGNWLTGRRLGVLMEVVSGWEMVRIEWCAAGFGAGTCAVYGLY